MHSTDSTVDFLILGAGPTGLGAAWRLQQQLQQQQEEHDHNNNPISYRVIDAAAQPGGMATTETDAQGFRWDLGGHVIHSHFPTFNQAIACHQDWVYPHRGGWVRIEQQWCPTPIQHNFNHLKQSDLIKEQLLHKPQASPPSPPPTPPTDLGAYYETTFGSALNAAFFAPFNFKQWAHPLSHLSHTWTSLRSGSTACNVPAPLVPTTAATRPADTSNFPYPRLGTGSLWHSIAAALPPENQRYNTTLTSLDLNTHTATFSTGETISYTHCISTIPLTTLLHTLTPPQQQPHHHPLTAHAPALKAAASLILGFGYTGALPAPLSDKTWIYAADPTVPFHRATVLTNFSPALSGEGRWSIMFETSVSAHRRVDEDGLEGAIVAELLRWGVGERPVSVWRKRLELGYPVPFLGRDELLREVVGGLEGGGCGRGGGLAGGGMRARIRIMRLCRGGRLWRGWLGRGGGRGVIGRIGRRGRRGVRGWREVEEFFWVGLMGDT